MERCVLDKDQREPWHRDGRCVLEGIPSTDATIGQLVTLGFPEPGHPYWTEDTLRGVSARYPHLDIMLWRDAAVTRTHA